MLICLIVFLITKKSDVCYNTFGCVTIPGESPLGDWSLVPQKKKQPQVGEHVDGALGSSPGCGLAWRVRWGHLVDRWTIFGQGVWGENHGETNHRMSMRGNHHFLAIMILSFWIWMVVVDSWKRTIEKHLSLRCSFLFFLPIIMDIMDISWKKLPQKSQNYPRKLIILEIHPFCGTFHDEMGGFWGWLPGFLGWLPGFFGVGFPDFWGWLPGFLGLASRIFVHFSSGFWMELFKRSIFPYKG